MVFGRNPDDSAESNKGDDRSIAEQLKARRDPAVFSRSVGGSCDACGFSEGSVIEHNEDGWMLCRSCYNDADTLEEYL